MPRQTGDATRRAILGAAYELFYRKGYTRVGVDEVAALAKVTKRTLYYHFRSKDDLLAEVLNWQAQLAIVHIRKYENNYSAGDVRKFVTTLFSEFKKWSAKPGWSASVGWVEPFAKPISHLEHDGYRFAPPSLRLLSSLRGAKATKQSISYYVELWIASLRSQ